MSDRTKRRYLPQPETCSVEGCDRSSDAREMCLMHYKRWRRHGTPTPRFRAAVVDGKRICPRCRRDMPVAGFRRANCADCFGEVNRQRQHVRRAGGGEVFTRDAILERDGFMCGICGGAIDPSLTYPHPDSPSLDHVIALSRGGAHTAENTQAAHLTCNKRKWAHPMKAA